MLTGELFVKFSSGRREYTNFTNQNLARYFADVSRPAELLELLKQAYRDNRDESEKEANERRLEADIQDYETFLTLLGGNAVVELEQTKERNQKLERELSELKFKLRQLGKGE